MYRPLGALGIESFASRDFSLRNRGRPNCERWELTPAVNWSRGTESRNTLAEASHASPYFAVSMRASHFSAAAWAASSGATAAARGFADAGFAGVAAPAVVVARARAPAHAAIDVTRFRIAFL